MRMTPLGGSGPLISAVGFGAWEAGGSGWGKAPPDERTISAMRAGFDAGMNWIDTAEIYGRGRSEELVGRAIAGREDIMVFTKVAPAPSGSGLRPEEIRRAVRGSLSRLGRERIDLLQIHWPDTSVPLEDTWAAMAQLVDEGSVGHIGLSNFSTEAIQRCRSIRHVDSLQSQFSMLHRRLAQEVFPFCKEQGASVLCYGPLAYGLLTGAIDRETKFDDDDWRSGKRGETSYYRALFAPGVFERNLSIVDRLRPVAADAGITLAQLALAWALHHDWCSAVIAGSRSPEHTVENAAAGAIELSESTCSDVEAVLGSA